MKLLLGLDLTDRKNEIQDGEAFVTCRIPEPLEKEHKELTGLDERFRKDRQLPFALRAVRWIAGASVIAVPCVLIEGCSSGGRLTEIEIKAGGAFLLFGLVMLLLFLYLSNKERELARKQGDSPEYLSAKNRCDSFLESAKDALGVPRNAVEMDMLAAKYHRVDGTMYAVSSRLIWDYGNLECSAWREADCFCFADSTTRFDIPLSSFRKAEKRKNGYYISAWNKPVSYRSPEYKEYKIHLTQGMICVTGYLAVRLEYEGEDYEMRIPPWEIKPLRKITGWDI